MKSEERDVLVEVLQEELKRKEHTLRAELGYIRNAVNRVERVLDKGGSLNSLGELQGAPSRVEAAVGAVEALRSVLRKAKDV
jgi:hypothetical protein